MKSISQQAKRKRVLSTGASSSSSPPTPPQKKAASMPKPIWCRNAGRNYSLHSVLLNRGEQSGVTV